MNISWSSSIANAHMRQLECSLEDFMDIFKPENVKEQPTKDGRNYIAGRLLDYNKPRGKGNIIDRCAVVLDCDDATPEQVKNLCDAIKNLGVRSVVHSTYTSTPDKPRVRVVIPLANDVVPGDYVALCKALMSHLNMVTWDESCAQAERAMYMPAKRDGYWATFTDGPLMNGVEWLKAHKPAPKQRTSRGNVAKRDKRRNPKSDAGIQGAFNRVYTIADAIEEFDLPYEPCREGRWTFYGSHSEGGLRLVEDREDLCISEHANSDPACFIDGNGSHRALSSFELCAVHLYGDGDDTSLPPRERASMQKMAKRAAEDEGVRVELGAPSDIEGKVGTVDVMWLFNNVDDVDLQARHAAEVLRDKLLYCEGLGWLVYREEQGVWERASVSAALACVAPVVQGWYYGSLSSGDDKFIKSVSKLRAAGSLRGLLGHVEAFLTESVDTFDKDFDLVCTANGVVDLRTGKLMPHSPKYHMTQRTGAAYVPGATHKAWDKALEALDAPERAWLQQWIGCGLTGYQPDDHGAAVPILFGKGSNGKSVIMTGVTRAFGGYAHMGAQSLLMPDDGKDLLRAAAHLRGVRLAYIEEAPDRMIHGSALKQVAATPTMKGEFKFRSEFTFNTTHSLMVSTNNHLRFDEGTDAVERRITILSFEYKYVSKPKKRNERQMDSGLLRDLDTPEAKSAILAWAVEGAKAYFAAGQHVLPPTDKMRGEAKSWLANGDTLTGFFNEMLIADPEAMIPWTHMHAAFKDYLRDKGGQPWNSMTFKNAVLSHRMFSGFKSGLLRMTGMDLYHGASGVGLKVPTGGRVAGMRGVRFRRDSDGEFPASEYEYVEPEVVSASVVEVEPEPVCLIDAEDVSPITHHVAPERDDVERARLINEINDLVEEVKCCDGGQEEVERLTHEIGAVSPAVATISQMRAFKMRLETILIYYYTHLVFPGERTRMRK